MVREHLEDYLCADLRLVLLKECKVKLFQPLCAFLLSKGLKEWIECGEYFERSEVNLFNGLARQKPEILNILKQPLFLANSFPFLLPQARQKLEYSAIGLEFCLDANNRQMLPYHLFSFHHYLLGGDNPINDE